MPGKTALSTTIFYSAAVGAAFILGPMAARDQVAVSPALPAGRGPSGIRVLIVSAVGILLLQTVCCRPGEGRRPGPCRALPPRDRKTVIVRIA